MNTQSITNPYRSDLLAGKTALVTGAGKGIGRETCLSLAACGATVVAIARTSTDLESLQTEAGSGIRPWVADATSAEFFTELSARPAPDILVNNIGINIPQPFAEVSENALDRMLDVNVRAIFRATQCVVRKLLDEKRSGSIINVSSQMGHVGSPGRTVYCATKHALEGFTKALAVELAPQAIRANTVAPTFIETPMTKPMLEEPGFAQFVLDRIPLGYFGTTSDVAHAITYLASDAAALVTGTSLRVDGGWTAQ